MTCSPGTPRPVRRRRGALAALLAAAALACGPGLAHADADAPEPPSLPDAVAAVVSCEAEGSCAPGGGPGRAPEPAAGEAVPAEAVADDDVASGLAIHAPVVAELTRPVRDEEAAAPAPPPSITALGLHSISAGPVRVGAVAELAMSDGLSASVDADLDVAVGDTGVRAGTGVSVATALPPAAPAIVVGVGVGAVPSPAPSAPVATPPAAASPPRTPARQTPPRSGAPAPPATSAPPSPAAAVSSPPPVASAAAGAPVVATPAPAAAPVARPVDPPARQDTDPLTPVLSRAGELAAAAGRSPWLPVGLVAAIVLYLLGQRALDRGSKLRYAGGPGEPDDELIEL